MKKNDGSKNKSSNIVLKIGITYIIPIFLLIFGLILISSQAWRMLFERTYFISQDKSDSITLERMAYNINGKEVAKPYIMQKFASLTVDSIGINNVDIYEGKDDQSLLKGIGHDIGSNMPGENMLCVLTGYRNVYFGKLRNIEKDDEVKIETSYGTYYYEVDNIDVTDRDIFDFINYFEKGEKLVMYTQYPFESVGTTTQLYVVTCRFMRVE